MKTKILNNYKLSEFKNRNISLQFYMLSDEIEVALTRTLNQYLGRYDMLFLVDILMTIIKEFINNGIKANIKRLHFKRNNLDIQNKKDYSIGMATFRDHACFGSEHIFTDLMNGNRHVKVSFLNLKNSLVIKITNNVPILDEELVKIHYRIDSVYSNDELSDIINSLLDNTESAGLGLAMALMICRNVGIPKKSFHITRKDNLTVCELHLPLEKMKLVYGERIFKE